METSFINAATREMQKVDQDGSIDKAISSLADPKMIKVAIPNKILNISSFMAEGIYRSFFNFPGVSGVELVKLSSKLSLSNTDFNFFIEPPQLWVKAKKTPCGSPNSTVLTYKPEHVEVSKAHFLDKKRALKIQGHKKKFKGTLWFCVKAQ